MHGINITKLDPGVLIEVNTKNSFYLFQIVKKPDKIIAHGGKYLPTPKECTFNGCVYAGMTKFGWIEYLRRMELIIEGKRITTSPVIGAKVVGFDWEYEMEWG